MAALMWSDSSSSFEVHSLQGPYTTTEAYDRWYLASLTLPTEPSSAEGTISLITSPGYRSLPEDMFRLQADSIAD